MLISTSIPARNPRVQVRYAEKVTSQDPKCQFLRHHSRLPSTRALCTSYPRYQYPGIVTLSLASADNQGSKRPFGVPQKRHIPTHHTYNIILHTQYLLEYPTLNSLFEKSMQSVKSNQPLHHATAPPSHRIRRRERGREGKKKERKRGNKRDTLGMEPAHPSPRARHDEVSLLYRPPLTPPIHKPDLGATLGPANMPAPRSAASFRAVCPLARCWYRRQQH